MIAIKHELFIIIIATLYFDHFNNATNETYKWKTEMKNESLSNV